LAYIWRNAAAWGADPGRIYVAGHSAGGHLATMLLATDWPSFGEGLPPDLVKGACAIGGIFDLEPIRLSFLNEKLCLSDEQVAAHSPLRQTYRESAPLLLIVAADESAEFHRQSREMARVWADMGYPVALEIPEGLDHFDVVNDLRQPGCSLVTTQLRHMLEAFDTVEKGVIGRRM
jgi:arylformamidase